MEKIRIVVFAPCLDDTMIGFYDELNKNKLINLTVLCSSYLDDKLSNKIIGNNYMRSYKKIVTPMSETFKKYLTDADVILSFFTKKDYDWLFLESLLREKLFFFCSERLFRNHITIKSFFRRFLSAIKNIYPVQKYKPYLLTLGKHTYHDYRLLGAYKDRAYEFAYFLPIYNPLSNDQISLKYKGLKERKIRIIVVGRQLKERKQKLAFEITDYLYSQHIDFSIRFIGDGPYNKSLFRIANNKPYKDRVFFDKYIVFRQLSELLRNSDVYVATAGGEEGYNCTAPCATFLGTHVICNANNGNARFYNNNSFCTFYNYETLVNCISNIINSEDALIDHIIQTRNIAQHHYSSKIAAERFYNFCLGYLEDGYFPTYEKGLFSKEMIKRG